MTRGKRSLGGGRASYDVFERGIFFRVRKLNNVRGLTFYFVLFGSRLQDTKSPAIYRAGF